MPFIGTDGRSKTLKRACPITIAAICRLFGKCFACLGAVERGGSRDAHLDRLSGDRDLDRRVPNNTIGSGAREPEQQLEGVPIVTNPIVLQDDEVSSSKN